jgi:hypothetical protein
MWNVSPHGAATTNLIGKASDLKQMVIKGELMDPFRNIYEFAASAGAFEGYVYRRKDVDIDALSNWVSNLKTAYGFLPREALGAIQPSIDKTFGRALRSLMAALGENHELVTMLNSMIKGPLPSSPDDFQREKGFEM